VENDIRIILNKENESIDLLFNGYNIVAHTIYNKELTDKILELIESELKNDTYGEFENFEQFLTMK
jgi:hypothetical protein